MDLRKARKKQKKIGKKAGYPEKACTASCNNICSNNVVLT